MSTDLRRFARAGIGVCALLLAACATPDSQPAAATATPEFAVVNQRETFALGSAITHVVVRNPHGDVRIRWSDQRAIGVYAIVQRIGAKPPDPRFLTTQTGDTSTLTVRYPGDATWAAGDHRRGRVDLGVWLPADMRVDVETSDGTAQIKGARQAVRVRTRSGKIEVSVRGDLDVESITGNIVARHLSGQWNGVARIASGSGNILAAIPTFADVRVSAHAGGVLSVDPALPSALPDAGGGMRLDAQFGAASHVLELRSGGNVHIVPVIRVPKRKN